MAPLHVIAEPGSTQILITREVDAPRDLVFRAFTEPELLVQWLGPRRLTMIVDRLEVRDGGTWRFVHRDADGNEFGFHGVQHGEASPDCMVRTNEFEGAPGHVSLETLTLEERGGKTLIRTNVVHQTVIARDMHLQNGMEAGMEESMTRLEELLAGLVPAQAATA